MKLTPGEKLMAASIAAHMLAALAATNQALVDLVTPEGAGMAVFVTGILILLSAFAVAGNNQPNRVGQR